MLLALAVVQLQGSLSGRQNGVFFLFIFSGQRDMLVLLFYPQSKYYTSEGNTLP